MSIIIEKLDGSLICRYLRRKHWRDAGLLYAGRVQQMLSPDESRVVLMPLVDSFSDYEEVMLKALDVIAAVECITPIHLYNILTNPSCDFLRWRIAGDSTSGGIIPFNSMGANIDYIKDMLGTACLDILSPAVYHAKVYTSEVNDQIAKYSFGQTEIGSYILNVLCPLGFYQYQLFDPETEKLPLSRKINLNILNNIETVQRSASERSNELNDCVENQLMSVNFLTSLTDMYEENKDSEITLSAEWNGDIPLLGNPNPVNRVLLQPKYIDRVMETVERYTPKEEQNVPATFFGKITNIGTEAEVENRIVFDIRIATIGENNRTMYVVATLNYAAYYQIADNALLVGATVKVTGIRTSTAKTTRLDDATIEVVG